jgi:hypothetical protein
MPITKRTLEKWRSDALKVRLSHVGHSAEEIGLTIGESITFAERILRLTSELLDQHLLRRKEG